MPRRYLWTGEMHISICVKQTIAGAFFNVFITRARAYERTYKASDVMCVNIYIYILVGYSCEKTFYVRKYICLKINHKSKESIARAMILAGLAVRLQLEYELLLLLLFTC